MKVSYKELKKIIKKLTWSPETLASKLSIIGHETAVITKDLLEIKLTTNRKDCRDIKHLAFDLIAVYEELGTNNKLINYHPAKPIKITLSKINKILGSNIAKKDYLKISRLGFIVKDDYVTAPDFRVDVFEGADIAEEVFRIVGSTALKITPLNKQPEIISSQFEFLNNLRATLSKLGASETKSISFTPVGRIKLKNPFSTTWPYMRDTLLYGLLETVSKNPYLRRNYFYEIGNTFKSTETTRLGIIITGYKKTDEIIKKVEKELGINLSFSRAEKELLEQFSLKQPNIIFAEILVNDIKLTGHIKYVAKELPRYIKISKFPPLVRDITISSESDGGIKKIKSSFSSLLIVELIDSYVNPQSKITSNTYRLIFQNLKSSFTQEQIKKIDGQLVAFL